MNGKKCDNNSNKNFAINKSIPGWSDFVKGPKEKANFLNIIYTVPVHTTKDSIKAKKISESIRAENLLEASLSGDTNEESQWR